MTARRSSTRDLALAAIASLAVAAASHAQVEWAELHPPAHPSGRTQAALAWDSTRGRALYVSGFGAATETWAFQHIGILSLEFHVDKLSRPLL